MRRRAHKAGACAARRARRPSEYAYQRDEVPALPGFCPSIAIWGGSDPLLPAGTRERLSALIPELEAHVIRPAGHFLTETHSRALRDYLRGWLKYVLTPSLFGRLSCIIIAETPGNISGATIRGETMPKLEPYSRKCPYSYALGLFPSLTLMDERPELAMRLLLHPGGYGQRRRGKTACALP